jgi:uncharacterized integral membrane protein
MGFLSTPMRDLGWDSEFPLAGGGMKAVVSGLLLVVLVV